MVKRKMSKKTYLVIGAIVVCVLLLASFFYVKNRNNNQTQETPSDTEGTVNLDPPTSEDAQRVADNKEQITKRQDQLNSQSGSDNSTVTPTILYADQYDQTVELGIEVPVFEDSGTCTVVFTLGSSSFTKTTSAVQNVNRMSCHVAVPASEFSPKGQWSAAVSYQSNTYTSNSASAEINVE